jgi:hydrogenase-1 operon protein HyaF
VSGLDDIRIEVQPLQIPMGSGNPQAILAELETALRALLETGKEHSIDLRSLPLAPGEIDYLRDALGTGEVRIDVDALGPSRIVETAIRGVWWVTHRNALDQVMAEFLEVSFCPDIVRAQRDDVRDSLGDLNVRLAEERQ